MPLFATIVQNDRNTELPVLIEVVLMLAFLLCFLRVSGHVAAQIQRNQLVDGGNSPELFRMSGTWGWFYILGVLMLIFTQSFIYVLLVLTGIMALLLETGRTPTEQFGLARLSGSQVIKWSLLVCGAVIFIEMPLSRAWLWIMDVVHIPHPEQQTVETFRQYNRPHEVLGFILQAVVLFPMIEELFFRGFLLTFLRNYTTTWLALILSAGVFAFAHANLGAALPLWFLGMVLGAAYLHTGSLLLPFGIHACWNFFTALSLLYDKGSN